MSLTLHQASAPRLFGLLDYADQLQGHPTPQLVASAALEAGLSLTGLDAGAIDLADRPGGVLRPLARYALRSSLDDVLHSQGPFTSQWDSLCLEGDGAVITSEDLGALGGSADATNASLLAAGVRALASTLLIVRGGAVGLLTYLCDTPRVFTADDLNFVRAIARITGMSIERARQQEIANRNIARLAAISEAQRSIAESRSRENLCRTVPPHVERIIEAAWLDIVLYSEDTNTIQFVHMRRNGTRLEQATPSEMEALAAVAARIVDRRHPLLRSTFDDNAQGERDSNQGAFSELVVPIWTHDRALGFVRVASGNAFAYVDEDVAVLAMLASQVGDALVTLRQRELKDEFMSIVCHELRGPLTAISGYAQLLERRLVAAAARKELLDDAGSIRSSAYKLSELIDDLTDLTRLETGRLRLQPSLIDPVALTQKVVADLNLTTAATSLGVDVRGDVRGTIADGRRVEQVLTNIVSNAVKYSSPSGEVTVRVSDEGDFICFSVQDQGVGIKKSELPHVFDRFYRASNVAQVEGFGLGLYISRMLVEALGGRITVESQPGSGSLFAFTIPVVLPAKS